MLHLLRIRRIEAEEGGADRSLARAGAQPGGEVVVEGAAVGGNRLRRIRRLLHPVLEEAGDVLGAGGVHGRGGLDRRRLLRRRRL